MEELVAAVQRFAAYYTGNDIMMPVGHDFYWINAFINYKNLDKMIHYVNQDGRVNLMYSTPSTFVAAKAAYNQSWPVTVGDSFPYMDCKGCYWSGEHVSQEVWAMDFKHLEAPYCFLDWYDASRSFSKPVTNYSSRGCYNQSCMFPSARAFQRWLQGMVASGEHLSTVCWAVETRT